MFFGLFILSVRKLKRKEITIKKLIAISLIIILLFTAIFFIEYYPIVNCKIHQSSSNPQYDNKYFEWKVSISDFLRDFDKTSIFSCKQEVYLNTD